MFKNVAGSVVFFAFDSTTGLPKSGDAANITAYVSKDYGAVTVLADTSAAEMDATNAKGYYVFALAQAETNADVLTFGAKSSTSNVVVVGAPAVVYPVKVDASLIPMVDVEHVAGLTPDSVALNVDGDGDLYANTRKFTDQPVTAAAPVAVLASVGTAATSTAQTGDGFARIGALGAGLTALAPSATALSSAVWTGGKAAFIDAAISSVGGAGGPTAAEIATAVFTDTTSSDFTTTGSPGKFLMTQFAGAFTGTTPVYTADALANSPVASGGATASAVAAAVRDVSNASPANSSLGAAVNTAANNGSGLAGLSKVAASPAPTASTFKATKSDGSALPAVDAYFVNATDPLFACWTSGSLAPALKFRITGYTAAGVFTVSPAMPLVPASGDTFDII